MVLPQVIFVFSLPEAFVGEASPTQMWLIHLKIAAIQRYSSVNLYI
ncbi:hypothetical protein H6G33_04700 [Calothrix sp. FACHB-1219]|nr:MULTISPECIES: hypothetical protein [unclassified Calothrix]MBD2203378.1 hypothetical protein [Calothrix sp. FACHB-168]MBD2216325.1 hypothetical protein [Calothrix sp. FACHB-1219]